MLAHQFTCHTRGLPRGINPSSPTTRSLFASRELPLSINLQPAASNGQHASTRRRACRKIRERRLNQRPTSVGRSRMTGATGDGLCPRTSKTCATWSTSLTCCFTPVAHGEVTPEKTGTPPGRLATVTATGTAVHPGGIASAAHLLHRLEFRRFLSYHSPHGKPARPHQTGGRRRSLSDQLAWG